MNIEKTVQNMLKDMITAFKSEDFDSYEDFERAVAYLNNLVANGYIELLDERRETGSGLRKRAIVLFRLTDKGKEWLCIANL